MILLTIELALFLNQVINLKTKLLVTPLFYKVQQEISRTVFHFLDTDDRKIMKAAEISGIQFFAS